MVFEAPGRNKRIAFSDIELNGERCPLYLREHRSRVRPPARSRTLQHGLDNSVGFLPCDNAFMIPHEHRIATWARGVVTNSPRPEPNYRSPLTAYRLPLTAYRLPLTAHRLPLTPFRAASSRYCSGPHPGRRFSGQSQS